MSAERRTMPGLYRIVREPLDLDEAIRAVSGPDRGAIATFIGTTRDHHGGRTVLSLEYDAYVPMAEEVMRAIGEEVASLFGTPHVAIVHRIGRIRIGEPSVIIAVAAAHRREALAGCAHAIERLKEVVPIWKKEHYEDASRWIEGT
ncbi:MAG TPA: molybdenum cofactor biosynthesis protein MoaE [Candidatus Polarisedimenticolia bacterium]|jgi:molybdopterin synthase catalytic subunit|nr:molybdenum cofactor biosynthesis protein MoaE [Candidatus Polarisedimenticolia bacterium]